MVGIETYRCAHTSIDCLDSDVCGGDERGDDRHQDCTVHPLRSAQSLGEETTDNSALHQGMTKVDDLRKVDVRIESAEGCPK